ncbi:hypothetical protein DID88_009501 [Monilinia fructigena]|uniref:Uncharacterized protein n=1 Tax=Monilinia fructigena TaxID=38457 RepID=A0A395IMM6_9HELO|nr:hypothetical protein DID88_009501 [Monilinia fructigena]
MTSSGAHWKINELQSLHLLSRGYEQEWDPRNCPKKEIAEAALFASAEPSYCHPYQQVSAPNLPRSQEAVSKKKVRVSRFTEGSMEVEPKIQIIRDNKVSPDEKQSKSCCSIM